MQVVQFKEKKEEKKMLERMFREGMVCKDVG